MKTIKHHKRAGFTLIELLFAMALLGFMLTITISTFIGVFRFYNWSNYTRQTQQQARSLMETLTREIRFQPVVRVYDSASMGYNNAICVNSTDNKSSKRIAQQTTQVVKIEYNIPECGLNLGSLPAGSAGPPIILASGPQLRIGSLRFAEILGYNGASTNNPSVRMHLQVATGTLAVPTGGGFVCNPGDNFCGTADFTTVVNGRQPQ